jgi:hypothetical protein
MSMVSLRALHDSGWVRSVVARFGRNSTRYGLQLVKFVPVSAKWVKETLVETPPAIRGKRERKFYYKEK